MKTLDIIRKYRETFDVKGIERETSMPSNTLKHALSERRGIPSKHEQSLKEYLILMADDITKNLGVRKKQSLIKRIWTYFNI